MPKYPCPQAVLEGHQALVDGANGPTDPIFSHGVPSTVTDVLNPPALVLNFSSDPSLPAAQALLPSPCCSASCPSCAGCLATPSRTGSWGTLFLASVWASCTCPRVSDAMPRLPGGSPQVVARGWLLVTFLPAPRFRTCLCTAGWASTSHGSLLLLLPCLPLLLLWNIKAQLRG